MLQIDGGEDQFCLTLNWGDGVFEVITEGEVMGSDGQDQFVVVTKVLSPAQAKAVRDWLTAALGDAPC